MIMSTNVKTVSIELTNGTVIQMKGSLSIAKTIDVLETFMSGSSSEEVESSSEEEVKKQTAPKKKVVIPKRRVPPLPIVKSDSSSEEEMVEEYVAPRKRVQRNVSSKEEETRVADDETVTEEEKEPIQLDTPPKIGALDVPGCDYNMFYNVFDQVPQGQRDLISETWEKFGYLHIPSFGYGDIYSLAFPRIVVGTTPEQVTYDPATTGLHDLPICSCPSYQYGNKKWVDRNQDRQRRGGCKHIFFALDVLRIPHGLFKWEEKNQEKVDQIVAMTTKDLPK